MYVFVRETETEVWLNVNSWPRMLCQMVLKTNCAQWRTGAAVLDTLKGRPDPPPSASLNQNTIGVRALEPVLPSRVVCLYE